MSMDKDFINASKPLHKPSVNDSQSFIKGNAPDIKKEGKKKPLTKIFSFSLPVTYEEKLYEMVLDFAKKDDLKNQIVLDLYG